MKVCVGHPSLRCCPPAATRLGKLKEVETCIVRLDTSTLDLNGVVRLCREQHLFTALLYVYNRGTRSAAFKASTIDASSSCQHTHVHAGTRTHALAWTCTRTHAHEGLNDYDSALQHLLRFAGGSERGRAGSAAEADRKAGRAADLAVQRRAAGKLVLKYVTEIFSGRSWAGTDLQGERMEAAQTQMARSQVGRVLVPDASAGSGEALLSDYGDAADTSRPATAACSDAPCVRRV